MKPSLGFTHPSPSMSPPIPNSNRRALGFGWAYSPAAIAGYAPPEAPTKAIRDASNVIPLGRRSSENMGLAKKDKRAFMSSMMSKPLDGYSRR